MSKTSSWQKGWDSFKKGKKDIADKDGAKKKCPYEDGTEEYDEWVDGWDCARLHEYDPAYYEWVMNGGDWTNSRKG